MTENTKYLDELLLSYKQTIHELKQSNKDLKDIIDKLLNNNNPCNVNEYHHNRQDDIHTEEETLDIESECDSEEEQDRNEEHNSLNHENSQILQDIFKIVDDYNQSKSVKSFPSYEYFKTRGITRYMISKEKGLKVLRKKYFESRSFT